MKPSRESQFRVGCCYYSDNMPLEIMVFDPDMTGLLKVNWTYLKDQRQNIPSVQLLFFEKLVPWHLCKKIFSLTKEIEMSKLVNDSGLNVFLFPYFLFLYYLCLKNAIVDYFFLLFFHRIFYLRKWEHPNQDQVHLPTQNHLGKIIDNVNLLSD